MKQVLITDKLYDQLKVAADDYAEVIDVVACMYLERGLDEINRMLKQIEKAEANNEFTEAIYESRFIPNTRKH